MIQRLRGQLVEKDAEGVVLDVAGVGYRASASASSLRALPPIGEECVLHTRMVVREDAMLLFGFADRGERAAFDSLTAVSKVGPKLALAILSAMNPQEVAEAVGAATWSSLPRCRVWGERRPSGWSWSCGGRTWLLWTLGSLVVMLAGLTSKLGKG
jgi:Holliday junction DNA helicase RuvA